MSSEQIRQIVKNDALVDAIEAAAAKKSSDVQAAQIGGGIFIELIRFLIANRDEIQQIIEWLVELFGDKNDTVTTSDAE